MKVLLLILTFFYYFAIISSCSRSRSRERKYIYPCQNKFYQYYLDDEPTEYGFYAGEYEEGKDAYIGIVDVHIVMVPGRVHLNPPGIYYNQYFQGIIVNNSSKIYYFYKNRRYHKYKWEESQNAEIVPFAVDIGLNIGSPIYFGRVKK
ncbi:hypothetical protein PVAND_004393 [Polypedilum vanderplanki]|uniref:Uncharacterized protein n=1 Tax=Polypedilum vanderplanki TaxID=319348 RepID=A0A9J6BY07_POLVA|nr:hypothetical protein PVAND_004393 [Polypedilum vanderplanki]